MGKAFNPLLLFKPVEANAEDPQPADTGKKTGDCMVALGGDDNSVSIWMNSKSHPLVVLKDIFDRQILDLCWLVPSLLTAK